MLQAAKSLGSLTPQAAQAVGQPAQASRAMSMPAMPQMMRRKEPICQPQARVPYIIGHLRPPIVQAWWACSQPPIIGRH